MTPTEAKQVLKTTEGDVIQIGCTSKELHVALYNFCKRHQRMLYTYTCNEQDKINAGATFGTYHIIRNFESTGTFNSTQTVIYNNV